MADLDTVQKLFRAADPDNSGTLDKDELKKLFLETSYIIIGKEISDDDGARWAAECIKQSSKNGSTVTMALCTPTQISLGLSSYGTMSSVTMQPEEAGKRPSTSTNLLPSTWSRRSSGGGTLPCHRRRRLVTQRN